MHRIFLLSILCLAGTVAAQGERLDLQDDVPIDTYLALLAQVTAPRPTWLRFAAAVAAPCAPSNCAAHSPKAAVIRC